MLNQIPRYLTTRLFHLWKKAEKCIWHDKLWLHALKMQKNLNYFFFIFQMTSAIVARTKTWMRDVDWRNLTRFPVNSSVYVELDAIEIFHSRHLQSVKPASRVCTITTTKRTITATKLTTSSQNINNICFLIVTVTQNKQQQQQTLTSIKVTHRTTKNTNDK